MHIPFVHVPHLLLLSRVVMCAIVILGFAAACGQRPASPVSPTPEGAATPVSRSSTTPGNSSDRAETRSASSASALVSAAGSPS